MKKYPCIPLKLLKNITVKATRGRGKEEEGRIILTLRNQGYSNLDRKEKTKDGKEGEEEFLFVSPEESGSYFFALFFLSTPEANEEKRKGGNTIIVIHDWCVGNWRCVRRPLRNGNAKKGVWWFDFLPQERIEHSGVKAKWVWVLNRV